MAVLGHQGVGDGEGVGGCGGGGGGEVSHQQARSCTGGGGVTGLHI